MGSKMKFGIVLFMLFAAASALPARKIITFDDCPGTINVAPVKKSLSFNAKKMLGPSSSSRNGKSHQRRIPGCHQRLLIFECCILFIFFFFFFFLILFVCSVLFRKQPM